MINNTDSMNDILSPEEDEYLREAMQRRKQPKPDVDMEWKRLCDRVDAERRLAYSAWAKVVASVAAAVVLVVVSLTIVSHVDDRKHNSVILASDNNLPMTIRCNDAQPVATVSQNLNFEKEKTKTGKAEMIEVSMPRGKDCTITLPDGSRVWLNTESKLKFPSSFDKAKRVIELTGEAYFEVAADKTHPFVVETENLTVTATGTEFNVCAYEEAKSSAVVLVKGSVAVENTHGKSRQEMCEGQMSCSDSYGNIALSSVDTYPYTQRKDGLFYFHNKPLLDIMIELGRWYNKTVVFENEDAMRLQLHFVAERSMPLKSLIESLNEMDGVDITMGKIEITVR